MHGSEAGRAPDEDEPAISEAWRRLLHPRRGGIPGPALVPRPLTWREGAETTPEEAARRALRMFPDHDSTKLYAFVDTWIRDRGHGFAAAATLELGRDRTAALSKPRLAAYLRMRRYLAAAEQADYAAAVEAMDPLRSHSPARLLAAYLAPTESTWADEACTVARTSIDGAEYKLVAGIVGTPQQLARVGAYELIGHDTGLAELVTLADGLGAAALPAFANVLDDRVYLTADTRRQCLSVLAALPGDEAFEALAARLDQKYFSGALVEAAGHFPRRALRLLAKTANGATAGAAAARRLLAGHVRTHPELVDALSPGELPEPDAQLIASLRQSPARRREAAAEQLPPPLLGSPRTRAGAALPAWLGAAVGALPQILLRGGELALPAESVPHVLSMLAGSKPGEPHPGLAALREAADPRSLAEFGWALFEAWQTVGMPPKESWTLTALGRLGDDEVARQLAPLIRAWPGEGGHRRAVAGLEVLGAIGTDTALIQLHGIAQKAKFKGLKAQAQRRMDEIARRLELTADQLADRLIPDFGLDAEGTLWLDYGPRRFRVGFDEQLRPFVTDEAGARRKDLPSPNAKDDAELAAAARKRFSGLKKDVRTVSADVIRRLESTMATGRTWRAAEFRDLLLLHPLVWHITRRLVWLAGSASTETDGTGSARAEAAGAGYDGPGTAFRVAEDRTLATVHDEGYTLPEDAVVRLAHPLLLGEALPAWSELFADYEILQPFPQLGRPVYALTEEERGEGRLARFEGLSVPTGRVLGLVQQGWQRGRPMDAGMENTISRQLGENLYLVIDLDPGIPVGAGAGFDDQKLHGVHLSTRPQDYWSGHRGGGPRFGVFDPVAASELLGDLTRLTN